MTYTTLRKSLLPVLAAAALAAPVLSAAAPLQPAGSWTVAPLVGLDLPTESGLDVGPRLGVEAMYGLGEIAPKLHLDVGPRVAWAYNGGGVSFWVLDFLGTARFSYAASPQFALYGDVGMGIGYGHYTGGSDAMFDLFLAPGVVYALSPTMNLLGEVGFYFNTKSGYGTHIAIPTVGLQFKL